MPQEAAPSRPRIRPGARTFLLTYVSAHSQAVARVVMNAFLGSSASRPASFPKAGRGAGTLGRESFAFPGPPE